MTEIAVFYVCVACFSAVMACNIIWLVRHYYMMRLFKTVLANWAETTAQFNEIMDKRHQ